jgi:lipopolysaccharide export LptBFGC system permease protein LptF
MPVVALSLIWSAVLFGLEQEILARANRHATALDDEIRGRPKRTLNPLNRRWIIARDGSVYHYGYYDPQHKTLTGLSIYRIDSRAWRLASQTFASRATYDTKWVGDTGWTQNLVSRPPTWKPFSAQPLTLEPPDYFETEHADVELMTVAQLRRYVAELTATGFNHIPPAVELQRKLAFPLVTFVMTLLAVPFGVSAGRRGTLYGIGLGVVIALSYWVVSSVFIAIGKAGLLSPELAGWTPNVIVFACAIYLILTAKT